MIKEKLSSSCTVIDLQTRLAKIEQPMQSENKKVNKFLVDISSTFPDKFETVERIREIFLMKNSELDEEIKYGGITFNLSGQLIGGGVVYKKHISIEFSNGAQFVDNDSFLEGKGKYRRHMKINEKEDIKNKKINLYIEQAIINLRS